MNGSIIGQLILKDWRLNRVLISLTVAGGIVALVLTQFGGQVTRVLGSVWFFVALIVFSSMLPASAIVNERKKQTLAFIMSLPVSPVEYGIAKMLSVWAMFVVPWLTLLISALILVETRHIVPHGIVPLLLILSMLPLIGFCVIASTAQIAESEGWLIAASIVCNSSYWFAFYGLMNISSLAANYSRPAAVWNPAAVIVLSAELGFVALVVAATLFVQSKKRDFV